MQSVPAVASGPSGERERWPRRPFVAPMRARCVLAWRISSPSPPAPKACERRKVEHNSRSIVSPFPFEAAVGGVHAIVGRIRAEPAFVGFVVPLHPWPTRPMTSKQPAARDGGLGRNIDEPLAVDPASAASAYLSKVPEVSQ